MVSLSSPWSRRLHQARWLASSALALAWLSGCGARSERPPGDGETSEASASGHDDSSDSEDDEDSEDRDDERSPPNTCARWLADTRERGEGTWDGSVRACDPGDISDAGRENALRFVNLYRWLADLPAVTTSRARNELAQKCALLEEANWRTEGLSHVPPDDWRCYDDDSARAAITSNLSTGAGVLSIPAYFLELGAEKAMGHRRIILSNELGPIGLGSTGPGGASCLQALPGTQDARRTWVAWPPPGAFPLAAYEFAGHSLSQTGWSIQSDSMDFGKAKVTVKSGDRTLDVDVVELEASAGSESALRIVPNGWSVHAGESYAVHVTGVRPKIDYEFELVDCGSDS